MKGMMMMKTIVLVVLVALLAFAAASAEAKKRVSKRATATSVIPAAAETMANLNVAQLAAMSATEVINICNDMSPFECEENNYSQLPNDEFASLYLNHGLPDNCLNTTNGVRNSDPERLKRLTRNLPANIDYSNDGSNRVSSVKDQSGCGSCWCFAAIGAVEFYNPGVTFSEQFCLNCAAPDWATSNGQDICAFGGIFTWMFEFLIYHEVSAWPTEALVPYTGTAATCTTPWATGQYPTQTLISSYYIIGYGDEASLMVALNSFATATVMDGSHPFFQHYSSGVYIDLLCSQLVVNHGVLVVGYNTAAAVPYWIVKNSYGTSWGIDGYFRILLGFNHCGICTYASYARGE